MTAGVFAVENRGFAQAGVTQLVECDLAKVDVAGSNPVSRSRFSSGGILPHFRTILIYVGKVRRLVS